ncbi:MAG: O-antigen ligase family protein [Patescibacteria group bacterium]
MPELSHKTLFRIVGVYSTIALVSLLAYVVPQLNIAITILFAVVFAVITFRSLEWGALIVLAELCVGVYGYLLSIDVAGAVFSIRVIMFVIWMSIALVRIGFYERAKFLEFIQKNQRLLLLIPLFVLVYGFLRGLWMGNDMHTLIFDSNAWIVWLYALPFIYVVKNKLLLWHSILAAAVWWSVVSVMVMYIFGHQFEHIGWWAYHWLRDFRLVEITHIIGPFFRIFSQSMIFAIIPGFVLFIDLIQKRTWTKHTKYNFWLLIVISIGIVASQSRSFILGIGVAVIFGVVMVYVKKAHMAFSAVKTVSVPIMAIFSSIAVLVIFALFPVPLVDLDSFSLLDRFSSDEPAAQSRIQQLEPLSRAVSESPILGAGFGKTVTYTSSDPRIVAQSPGESGLYTTYAFEWGYFDMILKLGYIGFFTFIAFLYLIIQKGQKALQLVYTPYTLGLFLSCIALLVVHVTTPYLNHPIGIGYFICVIILGSWYDRSTQEEQKI